MSENVPSAEAENIIAHIFNDVAPIVLITGRHGRGKTDFALLVAEILLRKGKIVKFGSNIKILNTEGYDYTHITNLLRLKEWLYPKHLHKLFILDEAGINIDRRNPLGKLNREIRYLGFLLRKFRGKLILVSQRSKDIEGTFVDTDMWLGTFKKLSKKDALLVTNTMEEPYLLSNIPQTSMQYDTYDIAPFNLEPDYSEDQAKSLDQKLLFEWLKHGSYHKIAKENNMFAQQVKRIILTQVKALAMKGYEEI